MRKPTTRILFAADFHGSETCFRKWVNAATLYKCDALVFGGDISGKVVVPIVKYSEAKFRVAEFGTWTEVADAQSLTEVKKRLRAAGRYFSVMSPDEMKVYDENPALIEEQLFPRLATEVCRSWLELAEDRLSTAHIPAFVMLGNDDYPSLATSLAGNWVRYVDEQAVELPGGFEMISFGYSNPTPWRSPRELDEAEIGDRLGRMCEDLRDPRTAVFNIHCPPYKTQLDLAPVLDSQFRPKVAGGILQVGSVGSTAVREAIERFQPMIGLHGHIHESPGVAKLGRSLVVNPGSDYGDGVLRAALINLRMGKGVVSWQFIHG